METTAIYAGVFILGFIVGKAITAHAANKMLKEINDEVVRVTAILQDLAEKKRLEDEAIANASEPTASPLWKK